ncbi:dynein intermediate chain 4, axonemal isoform X4 [Mesocricetus auratus]|uniref:Dynein axonemal intermediate chain 4 n=1 Tax=Mesocricetus auratus TaxID=10036 RepID=A0ABM2YDW7_MESAU|nr:dynein intermediate chain 4, axonemal isoform X4 [Mesocricetus auratus]
MYGSPTSTRKQALFAASPSSQTRKSISFNPSKASSGKGGYAGVNQSRLVTSRTMVSVPEIKPAEKLNISSTKTVQVFDVRGIDVTPRPLYHPDPLVGTAKPNKLLTSQEGSLGSDFISSYSLYQNTINPSMLGQFTRSVLGSSTVSKSSVSTTESMTEDLEEPAYKRERLASFTDVRVLRTTPETTITKEDLEKNIEIILTETETLKFFDLPTVMFSVESEEAEKITQKNNNYEILCRNRLGNDLYVERMMQTFNGAPKNKEVQCDKIVMEEKGIMATAWDLYDSFNIPEALLSAKQSLVASRGNLLANDQDPNQQDSETSSLMDIENVILAKVHEDEEDNSEAILKSEKLHQDLFFMERVLMENVFQPKLAAYRQLPVLKENEPGEAEESLEKESHEEADDEVKKEDEEETEMELELEITTEQSTIPANLERLWSFTCDLTKGLNVSSLSWNKANPDLLAVGYGNFGFKEQRKGMACCWSIKNPMGPVYKVVWNPFCPDVFLSCSADWGVMIWHQETLKPFLSFYTTTYVVYDVAWSPNSAYIFAAANESRVEIWDLQISTLDPLIVNVANPGIKFTTVLFAKQTDCLLVGDSDGQVAVYELKHMPTASDTGRGPTLALFLFSVLLAVVQVRGRETVKLCGLEYVRTVIYICASSRWRRSLEEARQAQRAEPRNYFQLPDRQETSTETLEHNLPKMDTSGQELVQDPQAPTERLWQLKKDSVVSKRDLQALCCKEGCSMTELSTLC